MRAVLLFIGLGTLLGALSLVSPGSLFVVALTCLTVAGIRRFAPGPDRKFLLVLFLTGFLVRTFFSLGLDLASFWVERAAPHRYGPASWWELGVVDRTRDFLNLGDSDYYSLRGYAFSEYVRGVREPVVLFKIQERGGNGYATFIGLFYYLFGFSPIAVKWVNCLLGALLGPAVFFLTKECFDPSIAKGTGLITAFFPSFILWSATNLKDPSFQLVTVLIFLIFLRARRATSLRSTLGWGGLMAVALWIHATLRSAEFSVILGGCLFASEGVLLLLRKRWYALLIAAFLGTGLLLSQFDLRPQLYAVFQRHLGHFSTPGITYRYLPDHFYLPGGTSKWLFSQSIQPWQLIPGIGKAVFHFLVQPIPGKMDSLLSVLVYPQMMLWYLLLPVAFLGLAWSMRWNGRRSAFLALVLLSWTIIGALTSGNVGTVFRIRDMVTPLFFPFVGAGMWALVRPKETE